jgi:hypothetical protein
MELVTKSISYTPSRNLVSYQLEMDRFDMKFFIQ